MDIGAKELRERLAKGERLNLLDVRTSFEYQSFNIGGKNVPLGNLAEQMEEDFFEQNEELIVFCAHGIRSKTAVSLLRQHGFKEVRNLTGGLAAYKYSSM